MFCNYSQKLIIAFLACVLAAFGQPATVWWLGPLAASFAFALFWGTQLSIECARSRFFRGTIWFFCVQLVQLSWLLSHPYAYIYPLYLLLSLAMGLQFGYLSLFITEKNISSPSSLVSLAALWVMLEWVRLSFLSGFSWNPVGLYLGTTVYGLQAASLFGVYGLSFWVIAINLLALRTWMLPFHLKRIGLFVSLALLPYLYGGAHYHYHDFFSRQSPSFRAILVQTAFPVEEIMEIKNHTAFVAYVVDEWEKILSLIKTHRGNPVDLLLLPEFTVPFGTYNCVYAYEDVKMAFQRHYGDAGLLNLPPLQPPFAEEVQTSRGKTHFVNNAFWAQAIANTFNSPILLGLEDADDLGEGKLAYYSAALMIHPNQKLNPAWPYHSERYEKRVLVPMGEYIPCEFFKELAKSYGIHGSFTPGKEAKVLNRDRLPFGVSICYEETFGHLMRESRQRGAEVLANLTSDVWYPDSSLTSQHLEHARLRTVEAGLPLIRACNTGITCAIDSLGRTVASLPEYDAQGKWLAAALSVSVSRYHYRTPYVTTGDFPIIGGCTFALVLFYSRKRYLIKTDPKSAII